MIDAAVAAAAAGATCADAEPRMLSTVTRLKERLGDIIEPDFGLLDELLRLEVLSRRQFANVRSERTVYERNDALLDLLTTEEQCGRLLTALRRTGQQHVVNFVRQHGGLDVGAEYGDVRPLDEARMRKLNINGVQLLDLIDSSSAFVAELASVGCITWLQREHIINIVQPRDRNDKLLEWLTRRSVADFQKFINVLAKEQSHLVQFLVTDGVVVGTDAELQWDENTVDQVSQTEDRIVSQWREVSADEKHQLRDKVDEILRPLGYETSLLVIRRANSIALYFICMTLSAVMSLRDQWRSQQLRKAVQKLFRFLSGAARSFRVKRLSWLLTEYERCLEFFRFPPINQREIQNWSETVERSADTSKLSNSAPSTRNIQLTNLPLEMLEAVLMRTFLLLYSSDSESDDDHCAYLPGNSVSSERRAYRTLSSVSWGWWQTLVGWKQSPTGNWLKHQIKKLVQRSYRPFKRLPRMKYLYEVRELEDVVDVTQLDDVVYMICYGSSAICRFNATTHRRLTDIHVGGMTAPYDIAACEQTSQLYVAERKKCIIWRVSADGAHTKRWLPKFPDRTFKLETLSVTSTRLLVTSRDTHQLMQFDADADELRRVVLPLYMEPIIHAVESPTKTFIVSLYNRQLEQWQVAEVNAGGEVLRQFSGSRLSPFGVAQHVAVDSRGNIFVADRSHLRILLLDAQLSLLRVIIDEHQLNYKQPWHLCYREQSGQLLVGSYSSVAVFDVLR